MSDGQTIILGRNRETAHRILDVAPVGSVVNIKPPRRTADQNARMWAMLSDISRAKPEGRSLTPEQWKCVFLDAIGITPKWIPSLDGSSVINTGYKSSRLTVPMMSDVIELMHSYAAQNGIKLGDGND